MTNFKMTFIDEKDFGKYEIEHPETNVAGRGDVFITIDYKDNHRERCHLRNTLLRKGKVALAKSLSNDVSEVYDYYINRMLFGTNGVSSDTPKYVDESRSGLFGSTILAKNVISSVDTSAPTTAIFTSVITHDEANGEELSEMALEMKNGELYSMLTFPVLTKTSQMQLTINWRITLL